MLNKLFIGVLLVFWAITSTVFAQDEPKREMRSTWIASVANIDWPKSEHRGNAEAQKTELKRMFDLYQSLNMNAVFIQVRPECDALYNSAYEPWSRYLTYKQGDYPGYDPLEFAISEAHQRGIELHVWMNPYRINASTSDAGDYYHSTHVYKEHPDWAMVYSSGKKILNPGKPEVMSYIGDIVEDLVSKYSVDGVHFDDYFYSYDGTPSALDASEYALYGGTMSLGDWRRDNINRMIDTVYNVIQKTNASVRFGVSPFGIYKNGVPAGIAGLDAYSTIYCDPLAWLKAKTVDYITPQLYWPTGGSQDFETLVNWWANQVFSNGRHLYAGQGTYRLSDNPGKSIDVIDNQLHENKTYFDADNLSIFEQQVKGTGDPVASWTLSQIGLQIDLIRKNQTKNGLGSVFFSAKDFDRVTGLADYMLINKYTHPAIIPEMTWKNSETPSAPTNLRIESTQQGQVFTWDSGVQSGLRYAIYSSPVYTAPDQLILQADMLGKIIFTNSLPFSELSFVKGPYIVVTAITATGKEGLPSSVFLLEGEYPEVSPISPVNKALVKNSDKLVWSSIQGNGSYMFQVSQNNAFTDLVYQSDWIVDTVYSISNMNLSGNTEFFWRVRAKNSIEGFYSNYAEFITGYPDKPILDKPTNLSQNVATQPKITWSNYNTASQIQVIISKYEMFTDTLVNESFDATLAEGKITANLEKGTWYYLKIQGVNSFGKSGYTAFHTFKTTLGTIPEVALVSPINESVAGSYQNLIWKNNTVEGTKTYTVRIALESNFDNVIMQLNNWADTSVNIRNLNLEGGRTYFWQVKAKSEFGEGEYTEGWSFNAGYPTRPTILLPQHLSIGNDIRPLISWNADNITDSIWVEISEKVDFTNLSLSEMFLASLGSKSTMKALLPNTGYYIRISAKNSFGYSIYSSFKYFETGQSNSVHENGQQPVRLTVIPNRLKSGTIKITYYNSTGSAVKLQVYNLVGQLITTISPTESSITSGHLNYTVEADQLNGKGMFIVVASDNNQTITQRFIVY